MVRVGRTDKFERQYKELFRQKFSSRGEVVEYENDRAARDIGIHLTKPSLSGGEDFTSALCWFQLKGIMASTLSSLEIRDLEDIPYQLDVAHLRYWYMQPVPTYLALYLEADNLFLILNLKTYVNNRWGNQIFTLKQKSATIHIPKSSLLDEQAIEIIIRQHDSIAWVQALKSTEPEIAHCQRDFSVIWRLGTAVSRRVQHLVRLIDWQSKTRGEIHFSEKGSDSKWQQFRTHWQHRLRAEDLEAVYPYLEFFAPGNPPPEKNEKDNEEDEDEDEELDWYSDEIVYEDQPVLRLSNGILIAGENQANEYNEYKLGIRLNTLGQALYFYVEDLIKINFIEIDVNRSEFVSVAPWNNRSV